MEYIRGSTDDGRNVTHSKRVMHDSLPLTTDRDRKGGNPPDKTIEVWHIYTYIHPFASGR